MGKPLASDFAAKGAKYLGTRYSDLDCQALIEAMLRDVGVKKNWSGSNAMYRDMEWTGTPEECLSIFGFIPVGAWLFILEQDGNEPSKYKADGIGNASHVGVKTGSVKGAIHSSASRGCVCESTFDDKTIKNGGWNRVGFCKLLDYGLDFSEGEESTMTDVVTAVVVAESGSTVNMRKTPDGDLIARVPVGTTVFVTSHQGEWSRIAYGKLTGWMMSKFLEEEGNIAAPEGEGDVWAAINDLRKRVAATENALGKMGWNKADGSFG